MNPRRRFLTFSVAALAAGAAMRGARAQEPEPSTWTPIAATLPLVIVPAAPSPTPLPIPSPSPTPTPSPTPQPGDAPIVGPADGSVDQAVAWLAPRADASYTDYDLRVIAEAYRTIGDSVGMDWFTAIAQMVHETGSLTSFWSLRPQRNPAGIGVTGEWRPDPPPDTNGWAYNTQRLRWERGVSFATWAEDGVPAHLGRLLAYALRDDQATPAQRDLIAKALSYRGFPGSLRGVAPTWVGLNGRWAVPGTTYGQSLLALAERIRGQ